MIIRRQYTANFTTISNRLFDDERLAADEMGILVYLLSRPDNWEVRRPALQRRFGIGPIAMKRVIRSWMCTGWCQAKKIRLPSGKFTVLYDIVDEPSSGMTEEEASAALSLVAGETSIDESSVDPDHDDLSASTGSATHGQPESGEPVVADDGVAIYKDITNTDLTNTDHQNSERELARAREKHAINLVEFKRRYPTAASDDQGKIDEEWFKLEFDEAAAALDGIAPFLAKLKHDRRSHTPAAWKYLREKRWTLLADKSVGAAAAPGGYPRDSLEAKALAVLHDIAGISDFYRRIMLRGDQVYYRLPVTPRLVALAKAPPRDDWPELTHQQAGAWEALLREAVTVEVRKKLIAGARAPWSWPPRVDGTLSSTGPPSSEVTEEDLANFR
jgi:hypothetical protein